VNWVDLAIAAVIAFSGVLAFMRGFVREVLGIGAWIGAVLFAWWATPFVRERFHGWISNPDIADPVAAGAMFLVGLLFLNPLLGAAIGAGIGAASGSLSDLGINDGFMREVGETLPQGSAALCVLLRDSTPDRVIERLRRHAPHARLLRTNLSHTDEEQLRQMLEQASKQAEALRLA
jgi:hypothetical protein